jgi:hypothetical protein
MMSLYTLVLLGLMPAGGLLMGALATAFGSAAALGIGGVAYTLLILAGFAFLPALRRL